MSKHYNKKCYKETRKLRRKWDTWTFITDSSPSLSARRESCLESDTSDISSVSKETHLSSPHFVTFTSLTAVVSVSWYTESYITFLKLLQTLNSLDSQQNSLFFPLVVVATSDYVCLLTLFALVFHPRVSRVNLGNRTKKATKRYFQVWWWKEADTFEHSGRISKFKGRIISSTLDSRGKCIRFSVTLLQMLNHVLKFFSRDTSVWTFQLFKVFVPVWLEFHTRIPFCPV
jgi:hypothetical protein